MKPSVLALSITLVTLFLGVSYIGLQQTLRLSANEPQDAMAQTVAASLESGAKPSDITKGQVNIAISMAPFVIVYDKSGNIVSGNGYLNGQVPKVPTGVLTAATRDTAHMVTWTPSPGIRIASVSYATKDYYVLGGRSLKTTERHIATLSAWFASGWIVFMLGMVAAFWVLRRHTLATGAPKKQ